jgi:Ni,Fe-hydrogenase maturation factor
VKSTIIIGYGNPDREDDGVAWHVLVKLAERLGRPVPQEMPEGFYPEGLNPDLQFSLQLMPEMAETLADYDRVCFVDAHTGRVPQEISFAQVNARMQINPLTHHLTAESLVAMTNELYPQHALEPWLASIRGYQFGFADNLSPRTAELAEEVTTRIWEWLHQTPERNSTGHEH